jgi:nucleoid-associated protein YgaU
VRAFLLVLCAAAVAACGDASSSSGPLVSADAPARAGDGCVAPEAGPKRVPRTWLVRDGDSLRRIARKCYGDEKLWKAIADANPGKIGREDSVRAGVELTIPYDGL